MEITLFDLESGKEATIKRLEGGEGFLEKFNLLVGGVLNALL